MGFRIEDGTGNGNYAKVDKDKHLAVAAVALPKIASVSHDGSAFAVLVRHTIQSTGVIENVGYLQNGNANVHVHIQSVTIAVQTATGMLVTLSFGPTFTSGGTSNPPTQLNRGRAKQSGVIVLDNTSNDLVLGVGSLEDFTEARFGMPITAQLDGADAVILGPGDTLCMRVTGTAGDLITASAFLYEAVTEQV